MAFDTGPIPTENQFPCQTLVACQVLNRITQPLHRAPTADLAPRAQPVSRATRKCGRTMAGPTPTPPQRSCVPCIAPSFTRPLYMWSANSCSEVLDTGCMAPHDAWEDLRWSILNRWQIAPKLVVGIGRRRTGQRASRRNVRAPPIDHSSRSHSTATHLGSEIHDR